MVLQLCSYIFKTLLSQHTVTPHSSSAHIWTSQGPAVYHQAILLWMANCADWEGEIHFLKHTVNLKQQLKQKALNKSHYKQYQKKALDKFINNY